MHRQSPGLLYLFCLFSFKFSRFIRGLRDLSAAQGTLGNSGAMEGVVVLSGDVLNSTQSTKNTVITAIKSSCIQGAVLSAKRSSGARPHCGSVAPRRDYVI